MPIGFSDPRSTVFERSAIRRHLSPLLGKEPLAQETLDSFELSVI